MPNDASRKGAKAPGKIIKASSPFPPLRLCGSILCVFLVFCIPSFGQRAKSERFDPDGSFWLQGAPPNEFSDFGGINLNAKRSRRLPQPGLETNNGKRYRFKILNVKQEKFIFTTVTIAGVSYSFSGKFLKGGVYASGILDDETPVLEGTLTKFRDGRKLAEAKLKFVYFGGT